MTVHDIREYFTDGRRVSFIIERLLMWENPGWTLAPSEGAGYDLRAPDGGLWEVRSMQRLVFIRNLLSQGAEKILLMKPLNLGGITPEIVGSPAAYSHRREYAAGQG